MFTEQIIASVDVLTPGTTLKSGHIVKEDKNGNAPFILTVLAGKAPNRNIIAGTVGNSLGLEPKKTYALQVREVDANDHGRQFVYEGVQELTVMERIQGVSMLGNAKIVNVDATVENTEAATTKEAMFNEE